jgi:hypothetical protein
VRAHPPGHTLTPACTQSRPRPRPQASIPAIHAGAFELFVEYTPLSASMLPQGALVGELADDGDTVRGPRVRFVVEPKLVIGGEVLPVEAIAQQTVLTRCLGPMSHWDASFAETVAAGYNTVHFTPVQELGESGSAYSIYDQLRLSWDLFKGQPDVQDAVAKGRSPEEIERLKSALLRAKIKDIEERCVEMGVGGGCTCACACACA